MQKKKGKYLLIILSIIIALAMAIGTTYAWFIDKEGTEDNRIQAGVLDVDLLVDRMSNGDYSGTYTSVEDISGPIFDYDRWEPGYSDAIRVKVANKGNLALKYSFELFVTESYTGIENQVFDENGATNTNLYVHLHDKDASDHLEDYLEVYVSGTNVGTLRDVINDPTKITAGRNTYIFGETETDFGEIKVVMPTVNNNKTENASILFDIRLLATQFTYEYDGFNYNQYDLKADTWKLTSDGKFMGIFDTTLMLSGTDKPYAAVVDENGQPIAIVPLVKDGAFNIGNGQIVVSESCTDIAYVSTSGMGQSVIVKAPDGANFTVNAPLDTVTHYGFAPQVEVQNVGLGGYTECGKVARFLYEDNNGKVAFKKTSVVYSYMNLSTDAAANMSACSKETGFKNYTAVEKAEVVSATNLKDKDAAITISHANGDNIATLAKSNGTIVIDECEEHDDSDEYDIIEVGDVDYLVCKNCGGYSYYDNGKLVNSKSTITTADSKTFFNYEIAAHTHVYENTWTTSTNYHWYSCESCDQAKDRHVHNWNAGVVTVSPTELLPGNKLFTCTDCLVEKNESIPRNNPFYKPCTTANALYTVGEQNLNTTTDIVKVNGVDCYVLEVDEEKTKAKMITVDFYNSTFGTNSAYSYPSSALKTFNDNFYTNQLGSNPFILKTDAPYFSKNSYIEDITKLDPQVTQGTVSQYVFALDAREANTYAQKFGWKYGTKSDGTHTSINNFWTSGSYQHQGFGYVYTLGINNSSATACALNKEVMVSWNDTASARPVFYLDLT